MISIIIPVFNALPLTRQCLDSILLNTTQPYEVILIYNGSEASTPDWPWPRFEKTEWSDGFRYMRNETNLGFAAACNQGILVANGEYLVLLNNDTMVPPRWAERLLNHLQACYVPDPNIGMVGPSLSRAGGVQECPAQYATYEEFCQVAGKRAVEYEGQSEEVPLLSGTCLMLPARVVREVGLLDERFFPGMFEDNDYCLRVRMAGYTLRWATDVFVHHEACQGFRQLAEPYEDILARNQARFREKWALGRYGI